MILTPTTRTILATLITITIGLCQPPHPSSAVVTTALSMGSGNPNPRTNPAPAPRNNKGSNNGKFGTNEEKSRKKSRKKSAAESVALRIGLSVVPKGYYQHQNTNSKNTTTAATAATANEQTTSNRNRKKKKKPHDNKRRAQQQRTSAVPNITWGRNAKQFFWGSSGSGNDDGYNTIEPNEPQQRVTATTKPPNRLLIPNEQGFPLYLLPSVLSPSTVEQTLSLLTDEATLRSDFAEEMEQHELVTVGDRAGGKGGKDKVRTLRRSLVARLPCPSLESRPGMNEGRRKGERRRRRGEGGAHSDGTPIRTHLQLLDAILSRLPTALTEGITTTTTQHQHQHQHQNEAHPHPYEDGSVVYYRTTTDDFYNAHHDSYDATDPSPPRKRQRAYTVLLYLRSPLGSVERAAGGTFFPRLAACRCPDGAEGGYPVVGGGAADDVGLVVKPRPGDALVWPNFDRGGVPYADSVHGALPLGTSSMLARGATTMGGGDGAGMGKIVVNLWFEGRCGTSTA